MSSYWHWSLGMIGAAISIILFGHKVPAIISPAHFAVIASWLTIGYGLLGWGVGILIGEGVRRMVEGKKK